MGLAVVKEFVNNARPKIEDDYFRGIEHFVGVAEQEFLGDTRRARIYKYILRNEGIPSKITTIGSEDVQYSKITFTIPQKK